MPGEETATHAVDVLAASGPGWVVGAFVIFLIAYFGYRWLAILEEQNKARCALDAKREERKQAEQEERAQRDVARSEMEGRIAAQMERSNALMEGMKALMESVLASNEALHEDFMRSRERSQAMADDVAHVKDRVDLMYIRESKTE